MNDNPLFSVLLCVYNGEDYISEAINSIIDQDFTDWELIIIDDGSTDETPNLVKGYLKDDPRIKLYSKKNSGLTKSLNYGLGYCKGDWIVRHDADDRSSKYRLSRIYNVITTKPLDFVYSQSYFVSGNKVSVKPSSLYKYAFNDNVLKFGNHIIHGSIAIRKEIIKLVKYDESCIVAQDFDLYLRLLSANLRTEMICEPLYTVQENESSISALRYKDQVETVKMSLRKHIGTDKYLDIDRGVIFKLYKLSCVLYYYLKGY